MFEIVADLKIGGGMEWAGGGVMQEVSHSHNVQQNRNEITQYTPEL